MLAATGIEGDDRDPFLGFDWDAFALLLLR
jgi:hypothetical protein